MFRVPRVFRLLGDGGPRSRRPHRATASPLPAPAGATVVMTFVNDDTNMPHNFALYTNATALTTIFAGDLVTGPGTITYTFTAPPAPGTYFFRCDVHPELMTGTFVVT